VKITRITFTSRELPFAPPLMTAQGTLHSRTSVYVAIHTGNGLVGVGEAAPLENFTGDTVEQTLTAAERVARQGDYPDLDTSRVWLGGWVHLLGTPVRESPSLFFALHCALTAIMCQYHRVPFPILAGRASAKALSVNALLTGETPDEVLNSASMAVGTDFTTIKVKVGTRPLAQDIALIHELRRRFPMIKIRVDANRAWPFQDAREFLLGVAADQLEFVEEPLQRPNSDGFTSLRKFKTVPLALDESLGEDLIYAQAMKGKLCDVLILKPTRLGSITWLSEAAERATSMGLEVVISSLMESELGLAYLANLASLYGSQKYAHGLATGSRFASHALSPPLRIQAGTLETPDLRTLHSRLSPDLKHDLGMV
jgi:L-Ala-D/L-Glu epimerase